MHYSKKRKIHIPIILSAAIFSMSGCVSTMPSLGGGSGNTVTGAAAGSTTEGSNSSLESCDVALGTLRVFEDKKLSWWREYRRHYPKLGSTLPVIRMMIQQSNCFVIVERGQAMSAMADERRLMNSGELRGGSNFGKGQMVAADYTLNPSIQFSQEGSGGMGGVLSRVASKGSSMFGGLGGLGSLIGGGAKANSNEASTTLLLIDNRSGVQVSSSVGSAKNYDFSLFGMSLNNGGFAKVSGFSNTPEGKVIIAAFADSYNQMVKALRNYKPQTVKGGLGKGGQLQVGADDDQTPVAKVQSEPARVTSTTVVSAQPVVVVTQSKRVTVKRNRNLNIEVDEYDEDAFEDYYKSLKRTINAMPTLTMLQAGQPITTPNGVDVSSQLWMVWSSFISQMETAKIELEFWPLSAKEQVWAASGKRIKKYNKLFNKHRKEIIANEQVEQRIRTSVTNFELVTEKSLFAE